MTGCTFRRYVHDRDACIEIPNAVEFVDMAQLLTNKLYDENILQRFRYFRHGSVIWGGLQVSKCSAGQHWGP